MRYRMRYRPMSVWTLPSSVSWEWAELPPDHPNPQAFPDVPRSRHRFGVFTTHRPLTIEEMRSFEIEEVG